MKLFYSYCHSDEEFREYMERHLSVLKRSGEISEWCDRKILPGQNFVEEIDRQMDAADIIVLLISSDFLASPACVHEMTTALKLRENTTTTVIPVIVRPCDWKHSIISSLLALPTDGLPITEWCNRDKAFLSIAEGIRNTIATSKIRLHQKLRNLLTETDFILQGQQDVRIDDIFVFPNITEARSPESSVTSFERMLSLGQHLAIRGDYRSGKTTICRKLFLDQTESDNPVLMFTGRELTSTIQHEDLIYRKFHETFNGSFPQWQKLPGKMLIVDDLDSSSRLSFISFAKTYFESVIITMSEDEYLAFFKDEQQLASFKILTIDSLKHSQQETLIRKWKNLSSDSITDGTIDQLEDRLNSIVLDKKVVPRFPFYILSILQTYEAFMPQAIQITAFGHCYHALITAQIIGAGIQVDDVDSAFNFLSHFAYYLFVRNRGSSGDSFKQFVERYRSKFVMKNSVLHRITNGARPLLQQDETGYRFRYPYAYYFLLGYYFARHRDERDKYIKEILEYSYVRDNTFIIIFTIHHAYDNDLIEGILQRTRDAFGGRKIASLDNHEVKMLEKALLDIPKDVVSRRSVKEERRIEREGRDEAESIRIKSDMQKDEAINGRNDVLLSLKNMEILGQILRNKYGSLPVDELGEIVSTIADAGLRLVGVLIDRDGIVAFEDFISEMVKEAESDTESAVLDDIRARFRTFVIFLVHILLKRIADLIGNKELRKVVRNVVRSKETIAYDLIGTFFVLGSADSIDANLVAEVIQSLGRCDRARNKIARRLASLETQRYLNTHWVNPQLRQRLYAALEIKYQPNTRV